MSQKKIYDLLQELGGTAFPRQIAELAKRKYPDATLHTYVSNRLQKLHKWGYVNKNADGSWSIIEKYRD